MIVAQLAAAGMTASAASHAEIVAVVAGGCLGAAVIADEAMAHFDLAELSAALAAQPSWSDSPFLLLTRREFGGWTRAQLAVLLGNVTTLERPLHSDALISAVRSALRARQRQRKAEAYLLAREAAEAQVRELAATLETRVAERTLDLSRALEERAEAERQLRESEQIYRYTIELTAQIPWTADARGVQQSIGHGWAALTGVKGEDWEQAMHPDDQEGLLAAWRTAIATTTPMHADCRIRTRDGSYIWCRSRAAPRLTEDGDVIRWYGTLEDIDDRRNAADRLRQMQAELIHVSRLSAMGTMASTLAHELNQPLTAIANYVRGSRRMLADVDDCDLVRAALDEADRSTTRAGEIVRRVRELVTKGDVDRQPAHLNTLVREACALAMIDARSAGITHRFELDPDAGEVMVDRIQIQQVLLNLLRNAVEALAAAPVRRVIIATAVRDAHHCLVVVRDSGPGIPADTAERLFKPFNTTKADGMGIGLSISRTIVEAQGGQIWNKANRGGGTTFEFTLPRVQPAFLADAQTPS